MLFLSNYHLIIDKPMEYKYHPTPINAFFHPPSSIYYPAPQLFCPPPFVANQVLVQPTLNYETAYFSLQQKYEQLSLINQELRKQLQNLTKRAEGVGSRKRKVVRRKQDQLDKKYGCSYSNCKKYYASKLALNLHVKGKHGGAAQQRRHSAAVLQLQQEQAGAAMNQFPDLQETVRNNRGNKRYKRDN